MGWSRRIRRTRSAIRWQLGLVDQLSVRPAFQRQGYGEALLDAMLAIFRAAGIARIELSVWAFNESARRFYERRGFATTQYRMGLQMPARPTCTSTCLTWVT